MKLQLLKALSDLKSIEYSWSPKHQLAYNPVLKIDVNGFCFSMSKKFFLSCLEKSSIIDLVETNRYTGRLGKIEFHTYAMFDLGEGKWGKRFFKDFSNDDHLIKEAVDQYLRGTLSRIEELSDFSLKLNRNEFKALNLLERDIYYLSHSDVSIYSKLPDWWRGMMGFIEGDYRRFKGIEDKTLATFASIKRREFLFS